MSDKGAELSVRSVDEVYGHVGRRLRALRIERGLTQAQAAQIIAVSPQQYQKYEDAQSKCSLPYLMTLSDYYGVHLNDVLPVDSPDESAIQGMPETLGAAGPTALSMASEADLLARLVTAFVRFGNKEGRLHLVQLVESMSRAEGDAEG